MGRKVRVGHSNDPEQVFTETRVRQLVRDAKVGPPVDIAKLRAGLIHAAKAYAAVQAHDANALRRKIAKLHAAARQRHHNVVAALLADLSPRVRDILNQRDHVQEAAPPFEAAQSTEAPLEAQVPEVITRRPRAERLYSGPRLPPLPEPTDLLDPAKREQACIAVEDRCEIGGRWVPGRKRPTGRRSRHWEPVLVAPEPNLHPEIRAAERSFIMWLQLTWEEATGKRVPRTAHRDNPGPFARVAQKALALLGAPHANAVELINDLERSRRDPCHVAKH